MTVRFSEVLQSIRLDGGNAIVKPTDAEPKWNKLLRAGSFYRRDFPNGKIELSRGDLDTMVTNWKSMGGQALRFDYHHWGSSQVDGVRLEDKRAAGWIEDLEVRGEELWGLTRWTEEARTKILKDEYRYVSPEFVTSFNSRTTGKPQGPTLISAGLLNDPFLSDLPRVAASAVEVPPAQPSPAPAAKLEKQMEKILAAALAALSLKEGATEESIAVRGKELKEQETKLSALATERDAAIRASTNVEPLQIKMTAMSAKVEALEARNSALEKDAKTKDVEQLVSFLMNDSGKARITAAQADGVRKYADTVGVEEARKFYSGFPAILTLGEKGIPGPTGSENPQSAYVKLQASAAELVKSGVPAADSLIRAMELNPELTKAAASLKSPTRS